MLEPAAPLADTDVPAVLPPPHAGGNAAAGEVATREDLADCLRAYHGDRHGNMVRDPGCVLHGDRQAHDFLLEHDRSNVGACTDAALAERAATGARAEPAEGLANAAFCEHNDFDARGQLLRGGAMGVAALQSCIVVNCGFGERLGEGGAGMFKGPLTRAQGLALNSGAPRAQAGRVSAAVRIRQDAIALQVNGAAGSPLALQAAVACGGTTPRGIAPPQAPFPPGLAVQAKLHTHAAMVYRSRRAAVPPPAAGAVVYVDLYVHNGAPQRRWNRTEGDCRPSTVQPHAQPLSNVPSFHAHPWHGTLQRSADVDACVGIALEHDGVVPAGLGLAVGQSLLKSDALLYGLLRYGRRANRLGLMPDPPTRVVRARNWFGHAMRLCDLARAAVLWGRLPALVPGVVQRALVQHDMCPTAPLANHGGLRYFPKKAGAPPPVGFRNTTHNMGYAYPAQPLAAARPPALHPTVHFFQTLIAQMRTEVSRVTGAGGALPLRELGVPNLPVGQPALAGAMGGGNPPQLVPNAGGHNAGTTAVPALDSAAHFLLAFMCEHDVGSAHTALWHELRSIVARIVPRALQANITTTRCRCGRCMFHAGFRCPQCGGAACARPLVQACKAHLQRAYNQMHGDAFDRAMAGNDPAFLTRLGAAPVGFGQ